MKRPLICSLALTALWATGTQAENAAVPQAAASWTEFRDPAGVFVASVPAAVTTENLSDPASDGGAPFSRIQYMSSVDGGQSAVFVFVSDLARLAGSNPGQVLQNAVDGTKNICVRSIPTRPPARTGNRAGKYAASPRTIIASWIACSW